MASALINCIRPNMVKLNWKLDVGEKKYKKISKVLGVLDTLKVHQCEEVPTRKIAAFSYFYDRAVDAGIIEHGQSAVVQVRGL